jgi:hypothetical protein
MKRRKKKQKVNCAQFIRTLIAAGLDDQKILKRAKRINPNCNLRWVTDLRTKITQPSRRLQIVQHVIDAEDATRTCFGLQRGCKVLRVYPPICDEDNGQRLPARILAGEVMNIDDEGIICKIFIDGPIRSQIMKFDKVSGMGNDGTGAFLIKKPNEL